MDYSLMGRGADGNVYAIGGGGGIRYIEKGDYVGYPIRHTKLFGTSGLTSTIWSGSNSTTGVSYAQNVFQTLTKVISSSGTTVNATRSSQAWTVGYTLRYSLINVTHQSSYNFSYSHSASVEIDNVLSFPMRNTVVNGSRVDCRFGDSLYPYAAVRSINMLCSVSGNNQMGIKMPATNTYSYAPDNILHPIFEKDDTNIKITLSKANLGSSISRLSHSWYTVTTQSQQVVRTTRLFADYTASTMYATTFGTSVAANSILSTLVSTSTRYGSLYSNQFTNNNLVKAAADVWLQQQQDIYNTASSYTLNIFSAYRVDLFDREHDGVYFANLRDYQITEYK